ncbi:MAG: RNA polymerase sigma factor [Ruminococcus sp.]|nr:RNA polymerase sigma factor [Ruminococcus sp.]
MDAKAEFEKLYELTKRTVYNYIVSKCFNIDDTDDIFQNTYLELYSTLTRRTQPPEDPFAYVMVIAGRQLTRYYSFIRRMRGRLSIDRDLAGEELPDGSFDLEDSFTDRCTAEQIAELIKEKPLLTQKAFFLHYKRGLTLSETASLLGISEASVKKHIYTTLAEIKRKLEKEDKNG